MDSDKDPLTTTGMDSLDGIDEEVVSFGSLASPESFVPFGSETPFTAGVSGRSYRLGSLPVGVGNLAVRFHRGDAGDGRGFGRVASTGDMERVKGASAAAASPRQQFGNFGGFTSYEHVHDGKTDENYDSFRGDDERDERYDSFGDTGSTRGRAPHSVEAVVNIVNLERRSSFASSSSTSSNTTTSSCGGDDDNTCIQMEPASFAVHSGWHRRPSTPPKPSGLAASAPGRMVRRISDALAAAVGASPGAEPGVPAGGASRKASLVGRISRKASATLLDVRDFAVDLSRHASAHVIEALELHELPGLRRLQLQHAAIPFRRIPSTGPAFRFHSPHAEYDSSSRSSSCSSMSDGNPHRPTRRAHWANRAQFVLACVGYCVGLGTVWRFPYLCYKSGGGVFLIPYFVTLLLLGIPMLYMEMSVGQYTRRGPIGALAMLCPLFKGAGVSSVIISFIMSTFYNVLIAYSLYYLFSAFRSELPWNSCGHRWNTVRCWSESQIHANGSRPSGSRMPAEEFFENKVLHMSSGLDDPRSLRWELVACLLVAWVLVYFAVWKSVRSSGRMLYFTATLPFVLVLVFLGRALTLDGADVGLRYFFKPEWRLLGDAKVWVNALAQNFNSLGVALGSVVSLSSYNRGDNPILVDTLAVSAISVMSSMLVGLFAFATIGNIAHELNTSVEDVLSDGPGLVFVLYPQTMAKMPAAQFWSVCFFFMMLCLGLNTQFAMVEVVATSLRDGFAGWIKRNLSSHEVLVLLICVVSFLFGLPCVSEGGIYFFQLVDHYTASISIMYLAFFEVVGVAWLYGAGRLARNVRDMTGTMPGLYMRACWWVISPATLLAVWVFFLIDYEPPTYNNGQYLYPWWAEALGWGIASLSLAAIPVLAALAVFKAEGDTLKQKLLLAARPRIPESKQGSPRGESPLTSLASGKPVVGLASIGVQGVGSPESTTLLPHTVDIPVVDSEKA